MIKYWFDLSGLSDDARNKALEFIELHSWDGAHREKSMKGFVYSGAFEKIIEDFPGRPDTMKVIHQEGSISE